MPVRYGTVVVSGSVEEKYFTGSPDTHLVRYLQLLRQLLLADRL